MKSFLSPHWPKIFLAGYLFLAAAVLIHTKLPVKKPIIYDPVDLPIETPTPTPNYWSNADHLWTPLFFVSHIFLCNQIGYGDSVDPSHKVTLELPNNTKLESDTFDCSYIVNIGPAKLEINLVGGEIFSPTQLYPESIQNTLTLKNKSQVVRISAQSDYIYYYLLPDQDCKNRDYTDPVGDIHSPCGWPLYAKLTLSRPITPLLETQILDVSDHIIASLVSTKLPPVFHPTPTPYFSNSERQSWYSKIHWSSDCETRFAQTNPGTSYSGVQTFSLESQGNTLVIVNCYQGAYQPGQELYIYSPNQSATPVLLNSFDEHDKPQQDKLINGVTDFDTKYLTLQVNHKSAGFGGCGYFATYDYNSDLKQFSLVRYAYHTDCAHPLSPSIPWPTKSL